MTNNLAKNMSIDDNLDYGLDAPGLVKFFFVAGTVVAVMFLSANIWLDNGSVLTILLSTLLGFATLYLNGMGSLMLYWSKIQKIRDREKTLDLISWRGDEQVLDIGCGRGLMLIGAAKRLITGHATGIDIWEAKDQTHNTL